MLSERQKIIAAIHAAQELLIRRARTSFKSFVVYKKPDYEMQWFHSYICDRLNEFAEGKISKLMILLPPQHGKSELATRLFPAYALGRNPSLKVAITSYSDSIASGFNRAVQRNIDSEDYAAVFPDTKLNYSKIFGTRFDNYARTEHKFELVEKGGSLKSVGRGGSLTSEPVDLGIIDDLYKDRAEAKSMAISQAAWDWYVDVFRTRLHNKSQQLIMNTRWDENDICGRLIMEEPGQWEVIKFPAIRTEDVVPYDPREPGEALWESKHSTEKIMAQKALSQVSYNSLYQQDPKPNTDILIYPEVIEVPSMPAADQFTWGLDFGKTTGINALIRHCSEGDDDYYDECLYEPGIPVKYIVEALKENGYREGEVVWCDHIPTKIAELRRLGIAAFPAIKGQGSIESGIDKMKEGRIHYTARSINMRKEFRTYQRVVYGKVITNIPVDEDNHCMDANRYAKTGKYFRGV